MGYIQEIVNYIREDLALGGAEAKRTRRRARGAAWL